MAPKPQIEIADRKNTGVMPSSGVVLNNDAVLAGYAVPQESTEVDDLPTTTYAQCFDSWLNVCKNKQAEAIDEQDYAEAAERFSCDVNWIKAVFIEESGEQSFNRDGSAKALLERHLVYRNLKAVYPAQFKAISAVLGTDLCHQKPGGWKGGIVEWQRIKTVVCVIAEQTGDFNTALNFTLQCASFGKPQILAEHYELLGYPSPQAMVEEFHQNEDNQLEAFCQYVEKNGLDRYLVEASTVTDPLKSITEFAKGYNGKRCCDKGSKKNYAAEILATYRQLSGETPKFDSLAKSRIQQGNTISLIAKIFGLGATYELTDLVTKATEYKDKAETAITEADQLREQVSGFAERTAGLVEQLGDYELWLGILAIVLVISIAGNIWSLYARWDDRRHGYK